MDHPCPEKTRCYCTRSHLLVLTTDFKNVISRKDRQLTCNKSNIYFVPTGTTGHNSVSTRASATRPTLALSWGMLQSVPPVCRTSRAFLWAFAFESHSKLSLLSVCTFSAARTHQLKSKCCSVDKTEYNFTDESNHVSDKTHDTVVPNTSEKLPFLKTQGASLMPWFTRFGPISGYRSSRTSLPRDRQKNTKLEPYLHCSEVETRKFVAAQPTNRIPAPCKRLNRILRTCTYVTGEIPPRLMG